jgi:hypothetical protein
MSLAPQRLDALERVEAERTLGAAVVPEVALPITVQPLRRDARLGYRELRDAAMGAVERNDDRARVHWCRMGHRSDRVQDEAEPPLTEDTSTEGSRFVPEDGAD